jgi:hypothetical protein
LLYALAMIHDQAIQVFSQILYIRFLVDWVGFALSVHLPYNRPHP